MIWRIGVAGSPLVACYSWLVNDVENCRNSTAAASAKGASVHVRFIFAPSRMRRRPLLVAMTPDDAMALSIELQKAAIDARQCESGPTACAFASNPVAKSDPIPALIEAHCATLRELFEAAAAGDEKIKLLLLEAWRPSIENLAVIVQLATGEGCDFEAAARRLLNAIKPAGTTPVLVLDHPGRPPKVRTDTAHVE
jgi:hypothetical protein